MNNLPQMTDEKRIELLPTEREVEFRDKYTLAKECAIGDQEAIGYTVWLKVNQQSFALPGYQHTTEEADWMRLMLAKALLQVVSENTRATPKPTEAGATPRIEASAELHAKTLEILADARPRDKNVQETLRCAAKHLLQLGRELNEAKAELLKYQLGFATQTEERERLESQLAAAQKEIEEFKYNAIEAGRAIAIQHSEIEEMKRDKERLTQIDELKWCLVFNGRIHAWTVQEHQQVVGCLSRGRTAREAIDAAIAQSKANG